jgi:hypothetical protein
MEGEMSLMHHPNVKACWPTVRLDRGSLETLYVVETDLAIAPDDPAFDKEAFESLVAAAREYMAQHPHYHSVRPETLRQNGA